MSFTSWLFKKLFSKKPVADQVYELHPAVLASSQRGAAKRASLRSLTPDAHPVGLKAERQARRELLYSVVRDAMVRAEVLSGSYRFKVLSLDSGGRRYIIMMDLTHANGNQSSWLSEMEAQIARSARKQHDITVTAVYWRVKQPASPHLKAGAGVTARQSQSR